MPHIPEASSTISVAGYGIAVPVTLVRDKKWAEYYQVYLDLGLIKDSQTQEQVQDSLTLHATRRTIGG
jgi:hypothetical protein